MTEAGSHPGQSPITRTFFVGDVLHIIVQSDRDRSLSEWTMRLSGKDKAVFNITDPEAPKNISRGLPNALQPRYGHSDRKFCVSARQTRSVRPVGIVVMQSLTRGLLT